MKTNKHSVVNVKSCFRADKKKKNEMQEASFEVILINPVWSAVM